jgi:chromosome segregation protein
MFLERLEIQGFKTFAKKTIFTFLSPKDDRYPITAIVGANGSGKSNSADAIRWVLGEQSLKLLRGKQSDDVIFSGSQEKSRAGFAEVSIELNNEDRAMPIDYAHVVITRRLYRDGMSEYLLNEGSVRLMDIQLLLAQANVGQRSYTVIGQGMVDHILVATPEERKMFFDDATGVKQFQIKRHGAMLKLNQTMENLTDVEMVLKEIEPRMRSLKRQTARLEQRAEIETRLRELERLYYGGLWWQLLDEREAVKKHLTTAGNTIAEFELTLAGLEKQTQAIEEKDTSDDGLIALQKVYRRTQRTYDDLRRSQFEIEKEIELTKVKAQTNWAPLPLTKIIEEVNEIKRKLAVAHGFSGLKAGSASGGSCGKKTTVDMVMNVIDDAFAHSNKLILRLQRPNPEDIKPDKELTAKLKNIQTEEREIASTLKRLEEQIDFHTAEEQKVRTELIDVQRAYRAKQQELHALEQQRNQYEIEHARLEERAKALIREMDEFMKETGTEVRKERNKQKEKKEDGDTHQEIQRLRYKLELIGGIDPEILTEYVQTKERFDFLEGQVKDLQDAVRSTQKIVRELDEKIETQSKKIFSEINKKFQRYFKILFGGGTCELVRVCASVIPNDQSSPVILSESKASEGSQSEGVDILATPPGKRMKALNLLSGGERALTSIALLSAIMDVNPSPFVVLDEVDAALDEANTIRFATILDELAEKSQFIIITHNRATMEKADVLYGVTMGDDGISNLLSVHLEDIAQGGTARR